MGYSGGYCAVSGIVQVVVLVSHTKESIVVTVVLEIILLG